MRLPIYLYIVDYIGKFFGWHRPILAYRNEIFLRYLEKETLPVIEKYKNFVPLTDVKIPKIIWLFWWQGENYKENRFIAKCVERIESLNDFNIIKISKDNVNDYIDISDILPFKNKVGIQFISDIIRIRLLEKYGGIWLDISTYILSRDYLSSIRELPFYTAKIPTIKKSQCISEGKYTTFFLATTKNNPFMSYLNESIMFFIKKHNGKLDYLHTDFTIMAGYRNIEFIHKMIDNVPINNPNISFLNGKLREKFSYKIWEEITRNTYILKFSTKKLKEKYETLHDTNYSFLLDYDEWN